ncbi:MAG TPA: hypothetical protein ENJ84_05825, partial [Gammaproteobacteria bacterium]|nr:hypothetical protein [Gammaproteobacteria bacterium]
MANITLSIDEQDLKQARIQALQEGTSLNAVVRDFVKNYINQNTHYQQVTERLLQRAETESYDSGGHKW